jgi:hypothetical protein
MANIDVGYEKAIFYYIPAKRLPKTLYQSNNMHNTIPNVMNIALTKVSNFRFSFALCCESCNKVH